MIHWVELGEDLLSDVIRNNNKVAELSNACKSVHTEDEFTRKHWIIYSRIDYIFVSNSIVSNISDASTDWVFESSDHTAVKVDFTFKQKPLRGPGIVKVNTTNQSLLSSYLGWPSCCSPDWHGYWRDDEPNWWQLKPSCKAWATKCPVPWSSPWKSQRWGKVLMKRSMKQRKNWIKFLPGQRNVPLWSVGFIK